MSSWWSHAQECHTRLSPVEVCSSVTVWCHTPIIWVFWSSWCWNDVLTMNSSMVFVLAVLIKFSSGFDGLLCKIKWFTLWYFWDCISKTRVNLYFSVLVKTPMRCPLSCRLELPTLSWRARTRTVWWPVLSSDTSSHHSLTLAVQRPQEAGFWMNLCSASGSVLGSVAQLHYKCACTLAFSR